MAEELVITIKGDDQATDDLKRVLGGLREQEGAVRDLDGKAKQGAESQKKLAGGMGKMKVAAAAGAAAVAGLAAAATGAVAVVSKLAKAAADHGDNAAKTAQQIGVSAEALQEYNHVAQLSGANQQALESGFGRLARAANEAAQGKAEYADTFARLGVSVKDAEGNLRDTPSLVEDIAGKMADMESETEKVALAQEMFGKGGKDLLPMLNQGSEGIAAMRQEAHDLGIVMSDGATKDAEAFQDAMLRLKSVGEGVKLQLGSALMPALTVLFDAMRTIIGPVDVGTSGLRSFAFDAVDIVVAGIGAMVETIDTLSPFLSGLYTGIKQQGQVWKILWNVLQGVAKMLVGGLAKGLANIIKGIKALVDGAHAAAVALDMDMAGSLARASKNIGGVQEAIDNFSTDAIDSARGDIDDMGDALGNMADNIRDMPNVDADISAKLQELAGRVQEAQKGIAKARHATPRGDQGEMPTAPSDTPRPEPEPTSASKESDDKDAEKERQKAEQERIRNDLARARIEILKAEDDIERVKLERQRALMEMATEELTAEERKLRQLEIEQEYREGIAKAQQKQAEAAREARQKEADDIRAVADAFSGTGSQMAGDVGKVVDVFADIKEGSASSVDAVGAVGEAAASFAGQMGASAEAQAGILAIFETAMGFATLFTNPAESAGHFLAAANFGMIAATGGEGKTSGASEGASLGQGAFRESADQAAQASGRVLAENLGGDEGQGGGDVIYVDFSGATMLETAPRVQQRLEAATNEARKRQIRRRAARG